MNDFIIEGKFQIPTKGMKPYKPSWECWPPNDCTRLTHFWEDCGQLNWPHKLQCETRPCFFIQTNMGIYGVVMDIGGDEGMELRWLFPYLDKNVIAHVIKANVPVTEVCRVASQKLGAAFFIASRHPVHNRRVEMLTQLSEYLNHGKSNALAV